MTLLSLWLNLNLRGLPSNDRRWFEIQRDPTIDHSPGGAFCSHRVSRSFLFMDRGCGSCIDGGGQAIDVIGRGNKWLTSGGAEKNGPPTPHGLQKNFLKQKVPKKIKLLKFH